MTKILPPYVVKSRLDDNKLSFRSEEAVKLPTAAQLNGRPCKSCYLDNNEFNTFLFYSDNEKDLENHIENYRIALNCVDYCCSKL